MLIPLAWLLVLSFAAYRATRAVVRDTVTAQLRDRIANWAASRPGSRPRQALETLVNCPYCTGWWLSGAVLATALLATGRWHDAPLLIHVVEWLAVAGGQALLSSGDDTAESAREKTSLEVAEQVRAVSEMPPGLSTHAAGPADWGPADVAPSDDSTTPNAGSGAS